MCSIRTWENGLQLRNGWSGTDDGLTEATTTGSGSCSGCGDATTIRYTFAIEPYELEARFVLEDIPVPSF